MVELLIALAVTTIGLTGVMSMHSSSARANRLAKETTAATSICDRSMEELRGISVDEIVTTLGAGVLPLQTALADVDLGPVTYARTLIADEVAGTPGLVRFRIEVEWTEAGGTWGDDNGRYDHTISLEVVRTRLELL